MSIQLHNMRGGKCYMVAALAALILTGGAVPGEVVTLRAQCTYTCDGTLATAVAESGVVVRSLVSGVKPVYLTKGWRQVTKMKDGTLVEYFDTAANGVLVRAYAWVDGEVRLVDGFLTSDGRVMVDGRLFDIAGPP